MRKLAQTKNSFPQIAEARPEEKQLSANCGNFVHQLHVCGIANLAVLLNKAHFVDEANAKRKIGSLCSSA